MSFVQYYAGADAQRVIVDPAAVSRLDEVLARRHRVVPLAWNGRLLVAAVRPDDPLVREPVLRGIAAGIGVHWRAASSDFVSAALERVYGVGGELACWVERAGHDAPEAVAAPLLDALLREATRSGASDLHLSPGRNGTRCRLRVDGRLGDCARLPSGTHDAVVQRIKVLAGLDVAECRFPQDGRLMRLIGGDDVAFRVSSFPVVGGENLVLRVQDPSRRPASLAVLGLPDDQVAALRALLARPAGLLVVSGPVGSGKTTTLYALLGDLDDGSRHLITLEDPVEYPLEGVVQAAVDPSRRIDFGTGARALLRQDPDVLMIGEIRDAAGCEVALRAALSGHRVLATVHADDALATLFRLQELGASDALLASCLSGIVAQRLLAHADAPGRFPLIEWLAIDSDGQEALRAGGPAAFAVLDKRRNRPSFAAAVRAALQRGDCVPEEVARVFGCMSIGAASAVSS